MKALDLATEGPLDGESMKVDFENGYNDLRAPVCIVVNDGPGFHR